MEYVWIYYAWWLQSPPPDTADNNVDVDDVVCWFVGLVGSLARHSTLLLGCFACWLCSWSFLGSWNCWRTTCLAANRRTATSNEQLNMWLPLERATNFILYTLVCMYACMFIRSAGLVQIKLQLVGCDKLRVKWAGGMETSSQRNEMQSEGKTKMERTPCKHIYSYVHNKSSAHLGKRNTNLMIS